MPLEGKRKRGRPRKPLNSSQPWSEGHVQGKRPIEKLNSAGGALKRVFLDGKWHDVRCFESPKED